MLNATVMMSVMMVPFSLFPRSGLMPEGATQNPLRADPRRSCTERPRGAEEGRGDRFSPCRGEGAERPFPTETNNEHTRRRHSRSQFARRLTG
ncbi:hypothetical protein CN188_16090 [Sinorhizobium meliloti]|nr:hypothetical protein CN188_16090 [Sinorhizobium meliloti]